MKGVVIPLCLVVTTATASQSDQSKLGQQIFNDTYLSVPIGTGCITCHAPETGYTFGKDGILQMLGTNRKVPPSKIANSQSVAYTAAIAPRDKDFQSRFFWDGRAKSLQEQALGPLFSQHEMNLGNIKAFCRALARRPYFTAIVKQVGIAKAGCSENSAAITDIALNALAEFQQSSVVNRFSSKFDSYLQGKTSLSADQTRGLEIFKTKGQCATCHVLAPEGRPLFTDFKLREVTLPKNTELETAFFAQFNSISELEYRELTVSVKTPSLRNVSKKPFSAFNRRYGHNGSANSIAEIIKTHREGLLNEKPLAEIRLTVDEIALLAIFLETLEDN